ncbi:MAG: queuosine salvage family protein [Nanoarchaeota archaeon]
MKVLESIKPVIEDQKCVHIDKIKIKEFAAKFDPNKMDHWLTVSPFDIDQLHEKERFAFLFILDAISFCYWGYPKWQIQYEGGTYDGAQAMMASLGRAIEQGIPLLDSDYIANMQREDLEEILEGNVEIPLLDERLSILHEVGAVITREFKGDCRYVLKKAKGNALDIVDVLMTYFPSFEDSAAYRGHHVFFNKRAQLLSSDLSHSLYGLIDADKLTACADYKLPQVLRRYGILHYASSLENIVRNRRAIPTGSEAEVEIRAHTIHAVELIKEEIPRITSTQINDYLWLEGQVKFPDDEPYHLTRTTAY